ncbi:MAG: cytoskeletal protein CcmA (bactofilin family) [Methylophagaceae bacterium]|jgi:cytoskeletal protein CcmA (bactofilin family)
MFKKDKVKNKSSRIDTLIGQGTVVNGDISFGGGLRIDGNVNGSIYTDNDDSAVLTLSEQGHIKGEVKVPNLIINGSITGDVYSTLHVELAPKAKVQGNVYYRLLEMSMGAEVNGQLIHMAEDDKEMTNISYEAVKDTPKLDITSED